MQIKVQTRPFFRSETYVDYLGYIAFRLNGASLFYALIYFDGVTKDGTKCVHSFSLYSIREISDELNISAEYFIISGIFYVENRSQLTSVLTTQLFNNKRVIRALRQSIVRR